MFILFFLLWLLFNGKITAEIVVIGIIISIFMFAFVCKFMEHSIQKEIAFLCCTPYAMVYTFVLLKEIVKANFATISLIMTSKKEKEPVLVHFKTNLKTKIGKVILANSITLTPGTITVTLIGDEYTVHCLDKDFSEGISTSIFVTMLEKMEAMGATYQKIWKKGERRKWNK